MREDPEQQSIIINLSQFYFGISTRQNNQIASGEKKRAPNIWRASYFKKGRWYCLVVVPWGLLREAVNFLQMKALLHLTAKKKILIGFLKDWVSVKYALEFRYDVLWPALLARYELSYV